MPSAGTAEVGPEYCLDPLPQQAILCNWRRWSCDLHGIKFARQFLQSMCGEGICRLSLGSDLLVQLFCARFDLQVGHPLGGLFDAFTYFSCCLLFLLIRIMSGHLLHVRGRHRPVVPSWFSSSASSKDWDSIAPLEEVTCAAVLLAVSPSCTWNSSSFTGMTSCCLDAVPTPCLASRLAAFWPLFPRFLPLLFWISWSMVQSVGTLLRTTNSRRKDVYSSRFSGSIEHS